ncbi:hypothetical protein ACFPYJ_23930 [Paenibacillus solisilvae]|uniref:Uncharacterized protein n=1 Tax=Paenibacillus solisilvae TaxID=2486751 RepID=A0ABW0W1S2_9BACL
MGERLKAGFLIFLYGMVCGLLLAIFPVIESIIRFVFSLLALALGVYTFRRFEAVRSRIVFVVLAIFFFLLFTVVFTAISYYHSHPPNLSGASLSG